MITNVTKASGKKELFDADKINKVVDWACEDFPEVSPSEICMNANISLYEGIPTDIIHETLVKSAADLISEEEPDYQIPAGRLLMLKLRKEAYGTHNPPALLEHVKEMISLGWYSQEILEFYTEDEINYFDEHINHELDFSFPYVAARAFQDKYLVSVKKTGMVLETPQTAYMLVGMMLHCNEKVDRNTHVLNFYKAVSNGELSLPTPIIAGVRTPVKQYSSCVLIEAGDDIHQIFNANTAQAFYTAQRAGIGVNLGMIRGEGAPVRGGSTIHSGVVPIARMFQEGLNWVAQGGIRKGSANYFYPLWHYDYENIVVLKNNRGTEETRARHVDHTIQVNELMYKRLVEGGNITLFDPNVADGKLYQYFFESNEKFEKLYTSLEKDPNIRKKTIPAIEAWKMLVAERSQTGRIYLMNVDNVNEGGSFDQNKVVVKQSNLCVAPETKILTDRGYEQISLLEGKHVNVWNGEEWSATQVIKTGENQKLLTVETDSGLDLTCTPYHKFYVQRGYARGTGDNKLQILEKRANELSPGDKLIKFDLPVIEGSKTLGKAYENGFYSGDGCEIVKGKNQRIYLYHEKRDLLNKFKDIDNRYDQPDQKRTILTYNGKLEDKFFVPDSSYTIKSRLEWLAGYFDADGCVYRNADNQQIVATSVNKDFLDNILLMLQTMGIHSKVTTCAEEGFKSLPKNDGTGDSEEFYCQKAYRLIIPSVQTQLLLSMGIKFERLSLVEHKPNRDATKFIKVVSVVDTGRVDDTYCFTEPKRHMGMFNGILTGQCVEITLPTEPMNNIYEGDGLVSTCTLAAINLGKVFNHEDILRVARIAVRALDNLIDYQEYPVKAAEKGKDWRNLGIGVINYAYHLARNMTPYGSGYAKNLTHSLFEDIQFCLIQASNELAKEKGVAKEYSKTKYSKGLLPIDWYKKGVDTVHTAELNQDWEWLREEVKEWGLRNCTLSAIMPSESSSQVNNATNGIEPPRSVLSYKSSKSGTVPQIIPDARQLKPFYTFKWDMKDCVGYLETCAIIQKFTDQSISTNTMYKPHDFPESKLPLEIVLQHIFYARKLGIKTLYYHETNDGNKQSEDKPLPALPSGTVGGTGCESGACEI